MHWPSPFKDGDDMFPKDSNGKVQKGDSDYVETYKAMEKCFKSGKAKAIGVSNFSKAEMERLLKETSVVSALCPRTDWVVSDCISTRSRLHTRLSYIRGCNSMTSASGTRARAST